MEQQPFLLVIPGPENGPEFAKAFERYGPIKEAHNPDDLIAIVEKHGDPEMLVISSSLMNLVGNVGEFRKRFSASELVVVGKVTMSQLADLQADDVVPWPLPQDYRLFKQKQQRGLNYEVERVIREPIATAKAEIAPTRNDESTQPKGKERLITVISGKGGEGKTTVAMQTAMLFAKMGIEPLVIDADYTGNTADWITEQKPTHSILEFDKKRTWEREALEDMLIKKNNVKVLPVRIDAYEPVMELQLENAIRQYRPFYTVIIVDMHEGYSPRLDLVKEYATHIFVVTTPSIRRLSGTRALIAKLSEMKVARDKLHVIVNRSRGEESLRTVRVALEDFPGLQYSTLSYQQELDVDDDPHYFPALRGGKQNIYGREFRMMLQKTTGLSFQKDKKEDQTPAKKSSKKNSGDSWLGSIVSFLTGSSSTKKKKGGKR